MPELKPCPFCGGQPDIEDIYACARITCNTVGCGVKPISEKYSTTAQAIIAWNNRAKEGEGGNEQE